MKVSREVLLDAAPADVWRAITDDRELSAWFGGPVALEPTPGARATFCDRDGTRVGFVESVDDGRELAFRWWPEDGDGPASTVTFTIEEAGEGTLLTVVETQAGAQASAAWAARLLDLELVCLTLRLAPAP